MSSTLRRVVDGGGMMMQHAQQADMCLVHALFDHREEITRTITLRPDGVETLTESSNPAVSEMLQSHVESMIARVKEARPIHQRDLLFREIFRNASRISAQYERTTKGIRVIETSTDGRTTRSLHVTHRMCGRRARRGAWWLSGVG